MTSIRQRAIPFFDYRGAFLAHEEAFVGIFRDVLGRGAFIQQRDLADFERHLAEYLGLRHAIGVGNATDGLVMSLRAAGVGPGDEVVVPSHTMVATVAAVKHVGATPVLADCGADHLLDPGSLAAAITQRTRAVMPVHLNGRTCDMDAIGKAAGEVGLTIVEDAAQGLGSRFRGRLAGTFGVAAAFSFYPAKILGCLGDGGAVVTNDDAVAHQVRLLRDHGRDGQGEVQCWGFNSRLDNLQAAILDYQFRDYQSVIGRRRAIAATYQERLGDLAELTLPPAPGSDPDHHDTFQNYELEAEQRDALREFLRAAGVGTLIQWGGKAVHQFRALGFRQPLPNTDRLFQRALMLPLNVTLSDEDLHYICDRVREFYCH